MADWPLLRLLPKRAGRLRAGHPWAYANEIVMDDAARALAPGTVVRLVDAADVPVGQVFFHPQTLIAARYLDMDGMRIDGEWALRRLQSALALRERFFAAPFYRLVHAEADGLPGLIIDRFADVLVVQRNCAGIERLWPLLQPALQSLLAPRAIILRDDSAARAVEGLPQQVALAAGEFTGPLWVPEGGAHFPVEPLAGQKTGWFFDQRAPRAMVAAAAAGARLLDVFCHSGGFGVQAAVAGARSVTLVDSSALALSLAQQAAGASGVSDRCVLHKAEALSDLARRDAAGENYEIVVIDPPAFAKSRKDVPVALRGYAKLARLAARLVVPDGLLFAASCSHQVDAPNFARAIADGVYAAGRTGQIIASGGAGADHPLHPHLLESAYLKWLWWRLF